MKMVEIDGVPVKLQKHHFSKQLRLSVRRGQAMVTLPRRVPYRSAERFARSKSKWIQQQLNKSRPLTKPTTAQRKQARELLHQQLEYWAPEMDVQWQKLRVGNQSSRWGSCSSSGTLSFNWRAAYLPEQLLKYLVIHELAHVLYPNHSRQFWQYVGRYHQDYRRSRQQLKQIDFTDTEG